LLVVHAYDVEYAQVAGLDSRTDLYDIEAKVPAEATKDQFRAMLQNLLSNRFNMSLHQETKLKQAYELVVAKNGPRIRKAVERKGDYPAMASSASQTALDPEGFPILASGQGGYASVNGRARMRVLDGTMEQLASKLANQLDMPVANATGLVGRYDFDLYWSGVDGVDDPGPNLFSAVESQLGLRLRPRKAAVTMIVIDHVDRAPTGN
jgi:uncharacterized protein (TIGR03435 family)